MILLDKCDQEEELKRTEDRWMCDLGTLCVGLNSHNEVLSNQRRNFGAATENFGNLKSMETLIFYQLCL